MKENIALAFFTNFLHLVAAQIFLRRLQIILPVDLTAWTFILSLQFSLSVLLVGLLPRLEVLIQPQRLIAILLGFKVASLLFAAGFKDYALLAAIVYFAVVSAEIALLYRFSARNPESQSLARANAFINLGAALGLYIAEKFFFRILPLTPILIFIAGVQVVIYLLWLNYIKSFSSAGIIPESRQLRNVSLIRVRLWSAFAGFLLFAGLLIVHRILRIYLMDTADIIAEITVFSMVAGAIVSQGFATLSRIPKLTTKAAHLLAITGFLCLLILADFLVQLPRELLLFLTLIPLVLVTTSLYLESLSQTPNAVAIPGTVAANLIGSLAGAVFFGYFTIPQVGIERGVAAFAFTVFLILALRFEEHFIKVAPKLVVAGVAISIAILAYSVLLSSSWLERQLTVWVEHIAPGESIVARTETPQDIWLLTQKAYNDRTVHHRLIRNSHSMSGSLYPSRRYMKLMAYLGYVYAAEPKAALNIGYGTGLTAQALAELPLTRIDISDVSSEIVRLASLLHEREHRADPIKDARVSYHLGGARHFLKTTHHKYDIITGEPPPPANSSIAYLYTREFYELVRKHLSPGGVFTYWLPTHSVADKYSEAIWQTFCSVFTYCDLYAGTEANLVMVGYDSKAQIALESRLKDLDMTRLASDTCLSQATDVFSLLVQARSFVSEENPQNLQLITDDKAYIEEDFPSNKKRFWGLSGIPFAQQAKLLESVLKQRFTTELPLTTMLRPVLIYSADSVFDPFRGLRTLQALQPKGVSVGLAAWLLGIDPGLLDFSQPAETTDHEGVRIALASMLAKNQMKEAERLVADALQRWGSDEFYYGLKILVHRLLGRDQNVIRREALDFSQKMPRLSASFAQYAGL